MRRTIVGASLLHDDGAHHVRTERDLPMSVNGVTVAGGFQDVVLVASVPLSAENWQPLAEGDVVAISEGRVVGSLSP